MNGNENRYLGEEPVGSLMQKYAIQHMDATYAGMANELTIGKKNMVSLVSDNPLGDLIKPLRHEILLFDSYVAGTTHIKDESVFDDVKEGVKLILD